MIAFEFGNLDNCIRNDPPGCEGACYFHMDIRTFCKKLKSGNLHAAYRTLRDSVIFPNIVSQLCDAPCRGACELSTHKKGGLCISQMERSLCALLDAKKPASPRKGAPKNRKIAVFGSGPVSLGFAYSLGAKGYELTVFESSERIGGILCEKLPPDEVLREIRLRLEGLPVKFETGHVSVEAPEDFDAVLYTESAHLAENDGKVFIAVPPENAPPVACLAWGVLLARQLESFLFSGNRAEPDYGFFSGTEEKAGAEQPQPGELLSADGLKAQAARCLQCRCDKCIAVCPLMSSRNLDPFKLRDRLYATLRKDLFNPVNYTRDFDACTFCGKCTQACENGVDLMEYFRQARFRLKEAGRMSPAYHDFWLRDMAHASEEGGFYLPPAQGGGYLYFPGCQLGAMRPESVAVSFEHIRDAFPGTGILLSCCGAPTGWAGDSALLEAKLSFFRDTLKAAGSPTLITACSGCRRFFEKYLPEIKTVSVYELWPDLHESSEYDGLSLTVYDPCGAEEFRDGTAVREILRKRGISLNELPAERRGGCCGFGGHISGSNPDYAREVYGETISADEGPVLVYCAGCQYSFLSRGVTCHHALDILCGLTCREQGAPTYSRRRQNRKELRRIMEAKYLPDTDREAPQVCPELSIPDRLQQKMHSERITEDDILTVLRHPEAGNAIYDESDGCLVCHSQIGCITVWIRYEKQENRFLLKSVYCHRMRIEVERDG